MRPLGLAATLLVAVLASPAVASGPESVLDVLRATDELREDEAREAQAWAEESARMQVLLDTLEIENENAERQLQNVRRELGKMQTDLPPAPEEVLNTLEGGAETIATALNERLDALQSQTPPGLVEDRAPVRALPRQLLDDALHRLERAERAAKEIEVLVAKGRLRGELRSVEVLRLGGVAAWWRSLDGQEGGEAQPVDGELRLHPTEDAELLSAIARATAIAKGRRPPDVVNLPLVHARMAETERTP